METMQLKALFSLLFLAFLVSATPFGQPAIVQPTKLMDDQVVENDGFYLAPGKSSTIELPTPWSGRVWGRQGCSFDSTGHGHCETGDYYKLLSCNAQGTSPATLVEITLYKAGMDYYDISLVEGYNLPISFTPVNNRKCRAVGCVIRDLNRFCPAKLKVMSNGGGVVGCNSACDAFHTSIYCCTGTYSPRKKCQPTYYSNIFKSACPNAKSYHQDYDPYILANCSTGGNYLLTFCP